MSTGERLTGEYRPTSITLRFADGTYLFRLQLPQLAELQEKVPSAFDPQRMGAGLGAIYSRLLNGGYFYQDIHQIIRLGLIGGGEGLVDGKAVAVSPLVADTLIERYVLPAPMLERYNTAVAIAVALMQGYRAPGEDDDPGEIAGEG